MKIRLVRKWDTDTDGAAVTDYSVNAILPDGRRFQIAVLLNWGNSNPESDDTSLALAATLEHRVKAYHTSAPSTEEAEIEVNEKELEEIIQINSHTRAHIAG